MDLICQIFLSTGGNFPPGSWFSQAEFSQPSLVFRLGSQNHCKFFFKKNINKIVCFQKTVKNFVCKYMEFTLKSNCGAL